MNTKSPYAAVFACLLSGLLTVPFEAVAEPQTPGQRAGEISRVIPAVSIMRDTKSLNASPKTAIDWQDVLNTQATARARVALDDGSVLNIGSDSTVHVIKHDAGAQQTDLEISLGKMRAQAQKISQSGGKFEVHTPAGVAGVVGTDFYTAYENNIMTVMVFEGIVRVCNLAGVCVEVKAGQTTTVRNGDSSGPAVPAQATLAALTDAINNTNLGSGPGVEQVHHISKGTAITLAVIAAIPIIVIPIVATRGSSAPPPAGKPTNGCSPTNPSGC
jgi:hypothetical protein